MIELIYVVAIPILLYPRVFAKKSNLASTADSKISNKVFSGISTCSTSGGAGSVKFPF